MSQVASYHSAVCRLAGPSNPQFWHEIWTFFSVRTHISATNGQGDVLYYYEIGAVYTEATTLWQSLQVQRTRQRVIAGTDLAHTNWMQNEDKREIYDDIQPLGESTPT